MANKTPLVFGSDGLPQQVQSGDVIEKTCLHSDITSYDIGPFWVGKPGVAQTLAMYWFPRAVTFPANFSGSGGGVNPYAGVNPAATYTITARFYRLVSGSWALQTSGTITISTSGVFTFALSGGYTTSAGDLMVCTGQDTASASLSDFCFTLVGSV